MRSPIPVRTDCFGESEGHGVIGQDPGGLRLGEVPVDWHYRPQSKVRRLRDAARMLADVVRLWHHPPR